MKVRQRQNGLQSLPSTPGLGWGGFRSSAHLRSDPINMFCQNTAGAGRQIELFLSFVSLYFLPGGITFLSGSIKFSHRGIKLSHCDTIFESHIHNLWIYYGGGMYVCVCVCWRPGEVRGVNPPSVQSAATSRTDPV